MVVTAPTLSGRILGVNASANNRGVTLYGRFSFYAISSNHPTPLVRPDRLPDALDPCRRPFGGRRVARVQRVG